MAVDMSALAETMGLGDLPSPILTDENKRLNEILAARQAEAAELAAAAAAAADELSQLDGRVDAAAAASSAAKHLLTSRTDALLGEKDLERRAAAWVERGRKERRLVAAAGEETEQQVEKINGDIETREALLGIHSTVKRLNYEELVVLI